MEPLSLMICSFSYQYSEADTVPDILVVDPVLDLLQCVRNLNTNTSSAIGTVTSTKHCRLLQDMFP